MEDKKLQKEILKFIIKKHQEPKHNGNIINDISIEFKNRGCCQEMIDENLYSLVKNGKIISGREIDDMNHKVYSPLFVLEMGGEWAKSWWRKNWVVRITVIAAVIAAVASVIAAVSGYF